MRDKTVLITGATSGIGKATAIDLASRGAIISLLIRNLEKGKATKNEIIEKTGNKNIDIQLIDLADLSSVKKAAEELKVKFKSIDILINNAGGMFKERFLSKDGYELTFAMNHLGHFLLTNLLMENIKAAPNARIINISSEAQRGGRIDFDDLMAEKKFTPFKAYSQAKLANIIFTKSLKERLAESNISVFALHPGVVRTGFAGDFGGVIKLLLKATQPLMRSPEKGAETSIFLATEENIENLSGSYFKNRKVIKPKAEAEDPEIGQRLWKVSEELTRINQ